MSRPRPPSETYEKYRYNLIVENFYLKFYLKGRYISLPAGITHFTRSPKEIIRQENFGGWPKNSAEKLEKWEVKQIERRKKAQEKALHA
jgi:hypothetical protein